MFLIKLRGKKQQPVSQEQALIQKTITEKLMGRGRVAVPPKHAGTERWW